jgi:arylsulfatase A-like enzyme
MLVRISSALLSYTLLAACSTVAESAAEQPSAPRAQPNVVIFFTDDQGYGDLSSFGNPTIHTPHVDSLAAEGAKLTQFYVASPVCSPSRAALLTGCYPKRIGMQKHVIFPGYDYGLHSEEVTIADMLKQQGYATGIFGKWHLGHRPGLLPLDQGFDHYYGVPYSNDMSQFHRKEGAKYKLHLPLMRDNEVIEWEPDQREITRNCTLAALDFIDQAKDKPFFVYMPYSMPHIPIYTSEDFVGHSARGVYGDVIEEIDWSVGQVLARLEEHGLTQDTIVIFTTDNGPWLPFKEYGGSAGPLRGGKGSNWEGGQRVPCVVRWPGVIPEGSVRREMLTTMDIFPTLAAWVGANATANGAIDGRDVGSLLQGAGANGFDPMTSPFVYYTSNGALAGIRRGPWKLLLENGELYNVEVDISEQWDKAEQLPELATELRALAMQLDQEIEANARPVLKVDELLFDPAKPVNPDGTPFQMPAERRIPQ